ncbi:hypothetical protein [Bdellovibrio svalbardensis]|uniref:Uncharacterized protein n=1 Tax=Bdellovibrio svalbardensis TaxID=2972972 RepID=A0ABT6DKZ9_9BACT|nr:hypothetical protein [Bdellovibrio svalbardensis]MDG0817483.1 hypothetical protein [Bdellovibrio svalbardensis]
MKSYINLLLVSGLLASFGLNAHAAESSMTELYCSIRDSGINLNCQWVTKDGKKAMQPDELAVFIDQAGISAYVTVKSKAGYERAFLIDANAEQFKKLNEVKRSAALSEVSRYKNDLFVEIEKKLIKLSDELDSQAASATLVKYDSSIALDKYRRESHTISSELDGYRKNREKVCSSTPAFEQISRANSGLQKSLSGILYAFQTPGSCMDEFKVFKDKDGTVDLRQLDGVPEKFLEKCKKTK